MGKYHFTFLRHGQSEGNVKMLFQGQLDFPLSDLGHRQAKALGQRWQREQRTFDRIIASPLSRAYQTAEHVAEALGMEVDTEPLWMEQDFGALSSVSIRDFVKDPSRPKFFGPYDRSGGSGESRSLLYARAIQAIEGLFVLEPGRYLVVSHGALLNMVWYHILGLVPQPNLEGPRLMFRNTSFAEVEYNRDRHRWRVLTVNDHAHSERIETDLEHDLDVYFLRHGESTGNRDRIAQGQGDYALSERGRQEAQARAVGWAAEGLEFDRIIASPQSRALDTAKFVQSALGGEIDQDDVWMERHNGLLAGKHADEFKSLGWPPEFFGPYTPMMETGESIWQIYLRAGRAIQRVTQLPNGRHLVVSHGGLLNSALKAALGSVPQANFAGAMFRLQNAGFARLTYSRGTNQWRLYALVGSPIDDHPKNER
jgi:broad specificity phosphatase PhoE